MEYAGGTLLGPTSHPGQWERLGENRLVVASHHMETEGHYSVSA